MKCSNFILPAVAGMGLLAVEQPNVAFAQNQSSFALEEITVTARRREENLMEVPVAVTVMSAANIEAAGIKDLETLTDYTPGLNLEVSQTNQLSRTLNFRGLSVSSGEVFVDGVALGGAATPYLGSVERIEVLPGPQGVYFGRATFTGALNIVTKRPADEFQGRVAAEYGRFNTHDVGITLEGPLVEDKVGIMVTGRSYNTDGHYRNSSSPSEHMGWRKEHSLVSSIYFTPSEDLTVKVFLDYEVTDRGPAAAIALKGNSLPEFGGRGTQIPGVTGGSQEIFCDTQGTFGVYHCGKVPGLSNYDPAIISGNFDLTPDMQSIFFDGRIFDHPNYGNGQADPYHFNPRWMQHHGGKLEAKLAHLSVDYDFADGWTFNSLSAYHRTRQQSITTPNYRDTRDVPNPLYEQSVTPPGGLPCCRLPYIGFTLFMQNVNTDFDQEFRIESPADERLRGTLGVSYLYQKSAGPSNFGQGKNFPLYLGSQTAQRIKTPAVYGGVYYDVTNDLTLTAEARYQSDKVTAEALFPTPRPATSETFKTFSPRISVDYNFAENSMAFATWSIGYSRGGFNSILVGQPPFVLDQLAPIGATVEYKREKLENYELGIKSTWLDGRFRTQLVAYYQMWRNGQVPSTISFNTPEGGLVNTSIITNLGSVDLYGLEFEGDLAVNESLSVHATANWQTSDIKNYNYIPVGLQIRNDSNVNGNKFWGSPQYKATVSPTYQAPLMGDWDWFGRADWIYQGKYYIDGTNIAWLPSSHTVDLRAGVEKESLSLELYVTNLFDDDKFKQGEYGADSSSATSGSLENEIRLTLPQRRAFGVRARYNF